MPQLKPQNQKKEEDNGKPKNRKEKYWDPNMGLIEESPGTDEEDWRRSYSVLGNLGFKF